MNARLKELKGDKDAKDEITALQAWVELSDKEAALKKAVKDSEAELDALAYTKYPKLTEADIKALVIDDKWMATLNAAIHGELDRVSQTLTQRVRTLAERYEIPMAKLADRVANLEGKVNDHLKKMGFAW